MRRIVLSSLPCLGLPHFLHYLINGTIVRKKIIGHEMCIMIFSIIFVQNISHSKKYSARYYHNEYGSSCRAPIILVRL